MAKKSPHEIRCSVCEKGVLREKRADQDLSLMLLEQPHLAGPFVVSSS